MDEEYVLKIKQKMVIEQSEKICQSGSELQPMAFLFSDNDDSDINIMPLTLKDKEELVTTLISTVRDTNSFALILLFEARIMTAKIGTKLNKSLYDIEDDNIKDVIFISTQFEDKEIIEAYEFKNNKFEKVLGQEEITQLAGNFSGIVKRAKNKNQFERIFSKN